MGYDNSKELHDPTKMFTLRGERFVPHYSPAHHYVMRGGLMLHEDELKRRGALVGYLPLWPRSWLKEAMIS